MTDELRRDAAAPDAERAPPTSLARRFLIYQAERFPLAGFAPLITLFTFSSAAYSRRARGASGFVEWGPFAVGALTALVFFFVLRVLDEHKDQAFDRRYRPELPVPRGLVSLGELRAIGAGAGAVAVALNLWVAPVMIWPLLLAAGWATLMTREFFVPVWLRAHPTAYLLTHMAIMPLIDGYTTGLDWLIAGFHTPAGLPYFLAVTFANGVLIEVGRKIRVPQSEREGVDTYTKAWGLRAAPTVWLATLVASGLLAVLAAVHTGTAVVAAAALAILAAPCAMPAASFLRVPSARAAARIETVSQAWPAFTYVVLGALPFVVAALRRP